jgi:hypothetical protein
MQAKKPVGISRALSNDYYANRHVDTAKARGKVAKTNAENAAHGRATARRREEARKAEAARAATAELAKVWP